MLNLKWGNHKLGDDIGIFNMGTAKECPSRVLGLCETVNKGIKCYAEKPEDQYPRNVPAYRRRQESLWKSLDGHTIAEGFYSQITRRRKETRYIRFNESGDFWDQNCVGKLSYISSCLKRYGITTYGYTARRDLDFSSCDFLVKGSGGNFGNNGATIVILKDDLVPEGYIECPGSCKRCNLCKINVPHNIAFRKH